MSISCTKKRSFEDFSSPSILPRAPRKKTLKRQKTEPIPVWYQLPNEIFCMFASYLTQDKELSIFRSLHQHSRECVNTIYLEQFEKIFRKAPNDFLGIERFSQIKKNTQLSFCEKLQQISDIFTERVYKKKDGKRVTYKEINQYCRFLTKTGNRIALTSFIKGVQERNIINSRFFRSLHRSYFLSLINHRHFIYLQKMFATETLQGMYFQRPHGDLSYAIQRKWDTVVHFYLFEIPLTITASQYLAFMQKACRVRSFAILQKLYQAICQNTSSTTVLSQLFLEYALKEKWFQGIFFLLEHVSVEVLYSTKAGLIDFFLQKCFFFEIFFLTQKIFFEETEKIQMAVRILHKVSNTYDNNAIQRWYMQFLGRMMQPYSLQDLEVFLLFEGENSCQYFMPLFAYLKEILQNKAQHCEGISCFLQKNKMLLLQRIIAVHDKTFLQVLLDNWGEGFSYENLQQAKIFAEEKNKQDFAIALDVFATEKQKALHSQKKQFPLVFSKIITEKFSESFWTDPSSLQQSTLSIPSQ